MNSADSARCLHCAASLLPGWSVPLRLGCLLVSLAALGLCLLVFKLMSPPLTSRQLTFLAVSLLGPEAGAALGQVARATLVLLLLVAPSLVVVRVFLRAISPTPLHEKHLYRADRHIKVDSEQAERDYGEAIRLAPDRASYVYRRGLFYEMMGRLCEAQSDFQQALQLSPEEETRQHARIVAAISRTSARLASHIT